MAGVRVSPLQMKHMVYTQFHIQTSGAIDDVDDRWGPNFDFEGVGFDIENQVAVNSEQEDDPRDFMVTLNVSCPGKTSDGKVPPYNISLKAIAWFEVSEKLPKDKRRDMVQINGSSMMFSAMREAVALITGRLAYGPLTLPALQFYSDK